jgi:pyruvate dehydrogenase E1 component
MRLVPEQIAPWLGGRMTSLGTDGFGRSDSRESLRRHFEVNAEHIAFAALSSLARCGQVSKDQLMSAMKDLHIDPLKIDPVEA